MSETLVETPLAPLAQPIMLDIKPETIELLGKLTSPAPERVEIGKLTRAKHAGLSSVLEALGGTESDTDDGGSVWAFNYAVAAAIATVRQMGQVVGPCDRALYAREIDAHTVLIERVTGEQDNWQRLSVALIVKRIVDNSNEVDVEPQAAFIFETIDELTGEKLGESATLHEAAWLGHTAISEEPAVWLVEGVEMTLLRQIDLDPQPVGPKRNSIIVGPGDAYCEAFLTETTNHRANGVFFHFELNSKAPVDRLTDVADDMAHLYIGFSDKNLVNPIWIQATYDNLKWNQKQRRFEFVARIYRTALNENEMSLDQTYSYEHSLLIRHPLAKDQRPLLDEPTKA
jgi:hypothetical protein